MLRYLVASALLLLVFVAIKAVSHATGDLITLLDYAWFVSQVIISIAFVIDYLARPRRSR